MWVCGCVGVWVCGCAVGGQVLLLVDWMYLVRVPGSMVGVAVVVVGFLGCVLHIIFKDTYLTIYVRIYVYVMLLFYV